jgi:hypothetical protein
MPNQRRLNAIIEREDDGFVSLCPELDIASEGKTIEEARANLTVPVPLNDPVRRGTLSSIIRQSGLARTLFETDE